MSINLVRRKRVPDDKINNLVYHQEGTIEANNQLVAATNIADAGYKIGYGFMFQNAAKIVELMLGKVWLKSWCEQYLKSGSIK